ncbi:hypothetical protein KC640_02320 [Candidatus Dojkabacteria bacterium]|uniref:Uncharacterized protein n=1 Tax=Candidatus Dojkabacteria bacterium TaxID=2099670 RepID=A0A955I573_9BACT|nr:hypothetical protein [Candidatus Dojkabacteria bacterium]
MPDSTPTPAADPKPASKFKNKKLLIGLAIGAACIVVAIIVLVLALLISSQQSNNNSGSGSSTPDTQTSTEQSTTVGTTESSTSTTTAAASVDTIYYVKSNNIFAFNYVANNETQLTNFVSTDTDYVNIGNIQQINSQTLGFSKCVTVTGDFGCGIFTLNLNNNSVTEVKHLTSDKMILDLRFDTASRFAYLAENTAVRSLILNSGSDQGLEDIAVQPYGRGGFEADAQYMQFSPDHNKLLQISTSSARSSMDFNTYVYNLNTIGQPPVILANSTHPAWLNNNHVLYVGYQQSAGSQGFKVFNITSSSSTPFSSTITGTDVYSPAVGPSAQELVYTKNTDKQIWLYDISSDATQLVVGDAIEAEWIDSSHLAVQKVHVCLPAEICNSMTDYEYLGIGIFDMDSGTYVADVPGGESVYLFATLYN